MSPKSFFPNTQTGAVERGQEVPMAVVLWKISTLLLMKGDFAEGWRINIWAGSAGLEKRR